MAVKEWFRRLQPVQLYLMLTLSVAFFLTELVVSHVTHALTLLVDSYHMLCNIIALTGCIITIKYGRDSRFRNDHGDQLTTSPTNSTAGEESIQQSPAGGGLNNKKERMSVAVISGSSMSTTSPQEKRLKNTFGWARIDILVMLICCVFLASLCFSLLVEALQTLVHIDHHDEMHHPIPVLCVGAAGLLLNGICYLVIGGYTFHQGSFLHVTEGGDVVLDRVVNNDSVKQGQRRLSKTRHTLAAPVTSQPRQGAREMTRDAIGCVFVVICALLVQFSDQSIAKYVDPIISIISALVLLILSYPYIKESGLILLQTIPDTINIVSLKTELLKAFPDIVSIHDLHIWQLTANKVISTAHIIFKDPKVYALITDEVTEFFLSQGITQVTVQPEFFNNSPSIPSVKLKSSSVSENCLMQCRDPECIARHCCAHQDETSSNLSEKCSKPILREIRIADSGVDLKSVRIDHSELPYLNETDTSSKSSSSSDSLNKYKVLENQTSTESHVSENTVEAEQNQISKIGETTDVVKESSDPQLEAENKCKPVDNKIVVNIVNECDKSISIENNCDVTNQDDNISSCNFNNYCSTGEVNNIENISNNYNNSPEF